ncbi:hypothetical protein ACWEQL_28920 [Kitasatospora sp. NPDC004240]
MEITITIKDPTPEVLAQALALAALPEAEVTVPPDDRWTPKWARAYYEALPPRAQEILLEVVRNGGDCTGDEVRRADRNLRGSTGAFRRVLNEGAKKGL